MSKHTNGIESKRMFIDETFYLSCPQCAHDYQFQISDHLKRRCITCKKVMLLINFKYGSDTSYRNICNVCLGKHKKQRKEQSDGLSYTMMPCGSCLQEGKSIAEATVRVNSKGVWDIDGPHKHQKGIYKKEGNETVPIQAD